MVLPTPTYPQYTNKALGDGLFDQLMATVKHHCLEEYDAGRIRGDNYSKLYLGSMEAVMGNTTQYLLGILLIEEKQKQLEWQIKLLELQHEELRYKIDFLYPLEVLKTNAEIDLINAQIEKIGKEVDFLTQKIATELANTDGSGVTEDSVVGRQVALLRAQKLGFAGDIESKVAKMHSDYDAIWQTVQETVDSSQLSTNAITAMQMALETAQSMKDEDYVDPPLTTEPFPPIVLP